VYQFLIVENHLNKQTDLVPVRDKTEIITRHCIVCFHACNELIGAFILTAEYINSTMS